MESSLASIGAFSGQALQGINQLHAFFKDVSLARQRTTDLLDELQFLTSTLTDIQQLVARLDQASLFATFTSISNLKSQLKICAMEVTAWVQVTKDLDPSLEKGIRAFFKKVKVAVDNSGFEEMGRKISAHRQRLGLSLSVLGRCMDQVGFTHVAELSAKFDGLTDAHLKLNDSINKQIAVSAEDRPAAISEAIGSQLRPLETSIEDNFDRMSSNHSESQQSIHSLSHSISSLASQMSQLLEMANVSDVSQKHSVKAPGITNAEIVETEDEWCCDSISGIDDGFIEARNAEYWCIYCESGSSPWRSKYSHKRGRHFAEAHSFGKCNLMITYQTWDELMLHLDTFHAATRIDWASHFFRRKRKPLPLLRDQHFSDEHPSGVVESYTEGKIIQACLNMALVECGLPESCDYLGYWLEPGEIYESHWSRRAANTQNDARYKIVCLLEELLVSGNDEFFDTMTHRSEPRIRSRITSEVREDAPHQHGLPQRKRINAWFLQSLTKSLPLRWLLASGKVTADLTPTTSPDWMTPILAVWNIDEAATGAEQLCEPSDGAVDSRDDLKPTSDSEGSFASDDLNNAEMTASACSPYAPHPETNNLECDSFNNSPSLRSSTIWENSPLSHPLVSKYLIRIAESDLLKKRLDDLLHLRKALEKKRRRRRRREAFSQSLEPEEKVWLKRTNAQQDDVSTMLQEAKGELEELREQCLAAGLGDEIGRGSVSKDHSSYSSCQVIHE
ncbi:hypothetical protein BGZ57DRAFT_1010950 [Hyaloscypha finlandica]|nr:hypothetical protein BGZ57DRAFT_1010950 [Hyaloscypha finlandica]